MEKDEIRKIILGTSSYDKISNVNTVSITGDGGNAWGYFGPSYKKLAPRLITYKTYSEKLEMLKSLQDDLVEYQNLKKEIEEEYIRSYYETRLKGLNVYNLLEELKNRFGENIVFLCHEPIDEFCHRRVFVDYIELLTGVYIPEIKATESGIVYENPIRYKKCLVNIIK